MTEADRGWFLCRGTVHRAQAAVIALEITRVRHSRESGNLVCTPGGAVTAPTLTRSERRDLFRRSV